MSDAGSPIASSRSTASRIRPSSSGTRRDGRVRPGLGHPVGEQLPRGVQLPGELGKVPVGRLRQAKPGQHLVADAQPGLAVEELEKEATPVGRSASTAAS